MSNRFSLLPPNKTPFENAVDLSAARVDELPVDISKVIDPQSIPLTLLPWLAWSMSADMWRDSWSEEHKRWVTENSLQWHYKKGTAYLLRKYATVMGGEAKRLLTPPGQTYLMPAFTQAEKLAFLRKFPQIRVYPYIERAFYKYSHFTNVAYGRRKAFVGRCYVKDVEAWSRYTRAAELRDGNKITPLTFRSVKDQFVKNEKVSTFEEIVLPAQPTDKIILNAKQKKKKRFFGVIGYVDKRLIRIKRDITEGFTAPRETYNTVIPSVDFINVEPERTFERHAAQKGSVFPARVSKLNKTFLPKSIAWHYIYERWYVFDASRVPEQRHRSKHLGYTRLGIPAYNAEAQISMTGKASPREAWRFVSGHLRQHSSDNLDRAIEAVRQSKALRDKILIDTRTKRQSRVGDRIQIGQLVVGQFINI